MGARVGLRSALPGERVESDSPHFLPGFAEALGETGRQEALGAWGQEKNGLQWSKAIVRKSGSEPGAIRLFADHALPHRR